MVTSAVASSVALDARWYRRSAATQPGYHRGQVPRNRGRRYPADPPTTEEIIELLRGCADNASGRRTKALIVLLWRSGLRISETLALEERDLDPAAGSITVRRGKGGKRRIVGMDPWGWAQIAPWLTETPRLPARTRGLRREGTNRRPPPLRLISPSHVPRTIGAVRHPQAHRSAPASPLPRRRARPRRRPRPHPPAATRPRKPRRHIYLSSVAPEEVLAAAHRRPTPSVTIAHALTH